MRDRGESGRLGNHRRSEAGSGRAGLFAGLAVGGIGGDQDMARLQNGRAGEAVAVVFVEAQGFRPRGGRHFHLPFDHHAHQRILVGFAASLGVLLALRHDARFPRPLQKQFADRERPGRGKQRRAGIVRRMVLRLRQDVGFVDRHAIDGHRIENRARLGRHPRIRLLIGGIAGRVIVLPGSGLFPVEKRYHEPYSAGTRICEG